MAHDPVDLTARLIQCPSVTPKEAGALTLLSDLLTQAGFTCSRADRGAVSNLFARWGGQTNGRTFGFNGHTDVVPVGNEDDWTYPPFGAEIHDGIMYGRGACDMKSGVAAFASAAIDFVKDTPPNGSIVLAITGDEEGLGVDGTDAILDWMRDNGEKMDHCLVGEPTCPNKMGEMMKIGRRGSMTAFFTVTGVQGHAAYPHRAKNPNHAMIDLLAALTGKVLDEGTEHFDASSLQVTTVDVGNTANNVIPAQTRATANIRFNDAHSSESITEWLKGAVSKVEADHGVSIDMKLQISGESFVTPLGELSDLISKAVKAETGMTPEASTTGGTSDARFVKNHCPVVEFGLVGQSMHQVDECVAVEQIHQLKAIYTRILTDYFA